MYFKDFNNITKLKIKSKAKENKQLNMEEQEETVCQYNLTQKNKT